MKLIPENLDDLWVLYNIVQVGDRVCARTTREVKVAQEDARPTKGKRIPLYLGLKIEKAAFDKSVNRLRMTGIVSEAPEKIPGIMGTHHTISVYPGTTLTIEKKEWPLYQLKRIKAACEEKAQPILVVGIDDEECCIALLRHYEIDVKNEVRARLPGKLEAEKRSDALINYFKSSLEALTPVWELCKCSIILVGPSYIKNEFAKYVRDKRPEIADKIAAIGFASSGGVAGVGEALRSGILEKVAKNVRIVEETRLVEQVLSRLGSQSGDVSYGTDVDEAVKMGAVDHVLVADKLLREAENTERQRLEDLIRNVEKIRGKVTIVSTEHEAGKKLLGLGGIAALLRYPIA